MQSFGCTFFVVLSRFYLRVENVFEKIQSYKLEPPMTPSESLSQIRRAIKTLEDCEESLTEAFRIVILTLKHKEAALEKEVVQSQG